MKPLEKFWVLVGIAVGAGIFAYAAQNDSATFDNCSQHEQEAAELNDLGLGDLSVLTQPRVSLTQLAEEANTEMASSAEPRKRVLVRLAFNGLESRESRRSEKGKLLRRVLASRDLLDVAVMATNEEQGQNEVVTQADIMTFLRWIIDNQDQIIAFIQKIIALFDTPTTPASLQMPAHVFSNLAPSRMSTPKEVVLQSLVPYSLAA